APTKYGQLSRMFVRWDRSYIVEGFGFASFMLTRYCAHNRFLPILTFFVSSLRLIAVAYMIVALPSLLSLSLDDVTRALVALTLCTAFTALYYLKIEKSFRFLYGVAYAIYAVLCLQWILPWALITVRDERWGTR